MLSEEAFSNMLKTLDEPKTDRHFLAYTTYEGALQFDRALKKEVVKGQLEYLYNTNTINQTEHKSLKDMINASDEDYLLAEIIIDNYEPNI